MTENVLIRVCDDDEDVRRSWQFVLEGEGWNVRIYPDALTFLKEDDPLLPVIFVSGHGDINMAVKTIKDGAEDFLPKPVETLRLIETVRRAVERDRAQREAHDVIQKAK